MPLVDFRVTFILHLVYTCTLITFGGKFYQKNLDSYMYVTILNIYHLQSYSNYKYITFRLIYCQEGFKYVVHKSFFLYVRGILICKIHCKIVNLLYTFRRLKLLFFIKIFLFLIIDFSILPLDTLFISCSFLATALFTYQRYCISV